MQISDDGVRYWSGYFDTDAASSIVAYRAAFSHANASPGTRRYASTRRDRIEKPGPRPGNDRGISPVGRPIRHAQTAGCPVHLRPARSSSTRASRTRRRSGTRPRRTARSWSTSCTITSALPRIARRGTSISGSTRSPGSVLTLEFTNLDNVYNGRPGSVANELKTAVVSADGGRGGPSRWSRFPAIACG